MGGVPAAIINQVRGESGVSADLNEQLASVREQAISGTICTSDSRDSSAVEDEACRVVRYHLVNVDNEILCYVGISAFTWLKQHHVSPGIRYFPVIKLLEFGYYHSRAVWRQMCSPATVLDRDHFERIWSGFTAALV